MNEKYQQYLERIAAHAQAELDGWAVKFQQNPVHHLEWADSVFSAGGKLAAVRTLMYYLDSTEDFRVMVMRAAVDSGRFAKASSSPTGNLIDAHTRQWIAALAHDINAMGN
jgi:hypothetical protein